MAGKCLVRFRAIIGAQGVSSVPRREKCCGHNSHIRSAGDENENEDCSIWEHPGLNERDSRRASSPQQRWKNDGGENYGWNKDDEARENPRDARETPRARNDDEAHAIPPSCSSHFRFQRAVNARRRQRILHERIARIRYP